MAEDRNFLQKIKDNVMGTKEQNEAAKKRMAEQDAKDPNTTQAKVNRVINKVMGDEKKPEGYKNGGMVKKPAAKKPTGYKNGGVVLHKGKNC